MTHWPSCSDAWNVTHKPDDPNGLWRVTCNCPERHPWEPGSSSWAEITIPKPKEEPVSEINIGDTVKAYGSDDWIVVGQHSKWSFIDRSNGTSAPLSVLTEKLTKVEPFFEAGKTYTPADGSSWPRFIVERVDKDSNGHPSAYGKQLAQNGSYVWLRKGRVTFNTWREDKEW